MRIILYLFFVLLLVACKVGKPNGVLSEKKMEKILYEYHLAKALASTGDSVNIKTRAYMLACLRENGVTEAEFDSSMVWYCQHMDALQKIYTRVSERYQQELASLGASANEVNRYSTLSATGDTANIWNSRSFYLFNGNGFNNRMTFEIKADTSHKIGDQYMLNFRAEFLQKEGQRHGIATLAVQYDNDSVGHTERHFYGSGDNSLIISPASRAVKRVYGFIYMQTEWSETPRLLFIFQPSLVRMRTDYAMPKAVVDEKVAESKPDSIKADSVKRDSSTNQTQEHSLNPDLMHSRPMPRKMTH